MSKQVICSYLGVLSHSTAKQCCVKMHENGIVTSAKFPARARKHCRVADYISYGVMLCHCNCTQHVQSYEAQCSPLLHRGVQKQWFEALVQQSDHQALLGFWATILIKLCRQHNIFLCVLSRAVAEVVSSLDKVLCTTVGWGLLILIVYSIWIIMHILIYSPIRGITSD